MWPSLALLALPGALLAASAQSAAVSIASAANLVYAVEALNAEFQNRAPDVTLTSTVGASGTLFAQMRNGAPFDVFLSADTEYPARVVSAGIGEAASLRTFATGRLALWTTRDDIELRDITAAVRSRAARKIAIAQPRIAPYGKAAEVALDHLGLLPEVRRKFVVGESIMQTAQFVETGNADLGFVALSLVLSPRLAGRGRWIEVPPALYASVPLAHAAVLTKRGVHNAAARRYLDFLGSESAKSILREFGYLVKEDG